MVSIGKVSFSAKCLFGRIGKLFFFEEKKTLDAGFQCRVNEGPKGPKEAKTAPNTAKIARKLARKAKISTLGGTIMYVAGPCGSILVFNDV